MRNSALQCKALFFWRLDAVSLDGWQRVVGRLTRHAGYLNYCTFRGRGRGVQHSLNGGRLTLRGLYMGVGTPALMRLCFRGWRVCRGNAGAVLCLNNILHCTRCATGACFGHFDVLWCLYWDLWVLGVSR